MKRLVLGLLTAALLAAGAPQASARTLVYHLGGAPDNLDPAKCMNQRCLRVMWPMYEPLVNLSRDSRTIVPGLAESWDVSADGLTYVFRLRRGVRFHDGTPFNAAAARLNLERNYARSSPWYTATPPNVREELLSGLIRTVAAPDEQTLVIALKSPKPYLLTLIGMVSPDALAKRGAAVAEHPVGTGPFRFLRRSGDEIRLEAHRDYWDGRPLLDEIAFRIIPASDRAMEEFLAGRVHFVPEVEPLFIERVIANPAVKLLRIPALSTYYLGLRADRRPFQDARMRRAVTAGLDVDRAILYTSRGMAIPAHGPVPPGVDVYEAEARGARNNPDLARRLLKEAAPPAPVRLSLLFNGGLGLFTELAQAIKADLAKVDIAVDLVPLPGWREVVAAVREGKGDMFIYGRVSLFTDAEPFLAGVFQTGAVENLAGYSNPRVDGLLEQARGTVDARARLPLYRRAQQLIVDDAPVVFLFHEVRMSAYSTRVRGLDLNLLSFPTDRFSRVELRTE